MTRFALVLFTSVLWAGSLAQPAPKTDPEAVPPQVVVNIRKHALGPDIVDITVAAKDYPLSLLEEQCKALAANLNSEARGLSVILSGFDPKFKFAKANFATDGLIDREKGEVRLTPIVRAFVGGKEPWVIRSFLVTLDGEVPVEKQTLQKYESESVVLKAHVSESPKGIEYRILALTQEPSKIVIPERHAESPAPERKAPQKPSSDAGWVPLALVVLAGAAAGLLVYSALSGRSSRQRGRTDHKT